ncbi:MAG: alpha/beta hydrolase [Clostridia bacterium]|nr:alpha/beta hydrolase [Clostridia bacterium]
MDIQIETIKTKSFSMDYFRFGHGEKTLVILPGLSVQSVMGFADSVAQAYRPLTDDFTVYVFDRRKELPEACSVYDMARDTADAFRALGLDRIDLFGASQGGMIAQVIAIEQPELIHRLALGSTTARVDEARFELFERWIRLAKAGDRVGLYLAFGEAIYPPSVFESSRALLMEAAGTVTNADLRRFIILAEGTRGFDISDRLDGIACPVLVLGSKDDRVLGADASEMIAKRLGPRAALYMYDGYGHAAYDTAPDYRERLLRFLVAEEE